MELSERTRGILDYYRRHWRAHGFSPSFRDVVKHCDLSSTSVAEYHVHKLVAAGLLRQVANVSRAVVPVDFAEGDTQWLDAEGVSTTLDGRLVLRTIHPCAIAPDAVMQVRIAARVGDA